MPCRRTSFNAQPPIPTTSFLDRGEKRRKEEEEEASGQIHGWAHPGPRCARHRSHQREQLQSSAGMVSSPTSFEQRQQTPESPPVGDERSDGGNSSPLVGAVARRREYQGRILRAGFARGSPGGGRFTSAGRLTAT